MRDRDARAQRRGEGRGYARDDLEGHSVFSEVLRLFPSTPEEEGIAPLQPCHALALPRFPDHELIDLVLARVVPAHGLAHVEPLGRGFGQGEDLLLNEAVVDDHVDGLQEFRRLYGEKLGVTWTCADDVDLTWLHFPSPADRVSHTF